MKSKLAAVKLTANFEANLAGIEQFWNQADAPFAYFKLINEVLDTVIPNLERHPRMGRSFLTREIHSVEAKTIVERLRTRIGRGEIREYLTSDYLILYALIGDTVYLLSIKHHRQLSFNFDRFWPK
jgi:hypothetical protein